MNDTNTPTDLPNPTTVGVGCNALFGLSDAAKQAVGWLYSEQARNLSGMEARAAILEGFGVAVDRELRSIFSKIDEEGPLRFLIYDGLEPCSHNFDAITCPNNQGQPRPTNSGNLST